MEECNVRKLKATPMKKGEYKNYRGWTICEGENPSDEGYLIEYGDYQTWSPTELFEKLHSDIGKFAFGTALELLKNGHKLTREGWNGKGMFVVYQKGYPQGIPCNKQTAEAWRLNEGDLFVCNPYLQIKCANGSHSMWVPSINDVLAEDWVVLE